MQTWPAIVSSGLSQAMSLEKPSIVRLFDDLAEKIHRQYETIGLDFTVSKPFFHSNFSGNTALLKVPFIFLHCLFFFNNNNCDL